jgi:RHS repeat-associated protein
MNEDRSKTESCTRTKYTYDSAGRPSDAVDTANSINYAVGSCANGASSPSTGACYAPTGTVSQIQNGSNLVSTYLYSKRLQPCWFYATTGTALPTSTTCTAADPGPGNILDLNYNFNLSAGDNGNVIGITNNRDSTRTQSFTYDALNRITTGKTSSTSGSNCWGETYTIDQWGNLTTIGAVSGYTGCTQENLSVSATTNNQLSASGYSYDLAGNMLTDVANTYAYNAESEIKSAAGVNYTYDGDGNRLEKSSGKLYWYGAGTEILDESDASGNFTNEYVFFGGKRIAMRTISSGTIYYYEEDMLGSARTIVQAGQISPCYDADFYPFGGERVLVNTCTQNYKFEGKERDTETGNDDFGARYYSSRLGRWLSADWSSVPAPVPYANLTNPQTLNLYAMVSDNPETFADLDGHGCGEAVDNPCPQTSGGAPGTTPQSGKGGGKRIFHHPEGAGRYRDPAGSGSAEEKTEADPAGSGMELGNTSQSRNCYAGSTNSAHAPHRSRGRAN